jgi:hypothetical protein
MGEMRTIRLPSAMWNGPVCGARVSCAVVVDWFPELTDDEVLANCLARACGAPAPFPDPNVLVVEVPIPRSESEG